MSKVVFTNGCFDLIHAGHISLLNQAKSYGDRLIVAINSDESVRAIKGKKRPIINEKDRAIVLLGLEAVDEVRIFNDLTPEALIKEINPDVLVKGGDWKESEIIGAEFVRNKGGEVYSIPLREGYSTTNIIERYSEASKSKTTTKKKANNNDLIELALTQHIEVFEDLLAENTRAIYDCAEVIYRAIAKGHKILICGNGGSAADAQHIAAEFVGRYETERMALPAIALTTDTSALTALANDYGFEKIFSRQVEALAGRGDVLIAISTSGKSPNVIEAIMTARQRGCQVIGLTGGRGKKLASLCDLCVVVDIAKTSRIQEAHITIGHIWCEYLDSRLSSENDQ
jgi:D-sedoheptulose 7-phosphate isomerase